MQKTNPIMNKKVLLYMAAGVATAVFIAEIPEMIRYYKMSRL